LSSISTSAFSLAWVSNEGVVYQKVYTGKIGRRETGAFNTAFKAAGKGI
jgi:hypothetical protein